MTEAGEDAPYFPPGSMARRVHGDRAVGLLYGQRALLIGALEPLTYTGTMLSTRSRDRPFERLVRTAKIQETVLLGSREEADRALAAVHRLHQRIEGELPLGAGVHAAGTRYSALDPELMLWTLAVIADSGRSIYEAMVRRLSATEREDLWQDYVRFGELFGMPAGSGASQPPRVRAMVGRAARIRRPAGDRRTPCRWHRSSPSSSLSRRAARINLAVQNLLIKGTLPPRVRAIYGISWSRAHERIFQAAAASHRRARHLFPRQLRRGRNDVFFDVVSKTERLRGGTATPELRARA